MDVDQLLPGYQYGDAISRHAAGLRNLLRDWGYESQIFAQHIGPKVRHDCFPIQSFCGKPDGITVYHYSIGADEVTDLFVTSPGKRMLVYHNITPHEYFVGYDENEARLTCEGRALLKELACSADLVLTDSAFNGRELSSLGFPRPRVLPILTDWHLLDRVGPCGNVLKRYADDWSNFLFVGRLAPNKRQDEVIRSFAHYHRFIDRRSRLFLVGSDAKTMYAKELKSLVRHLGLQDVVEFPGHVTTAELIAFYRLADVFMCLSEHEGFCVPIVEAFYYEIPVIAYHRAAVPDTMGSAGILVHRKDYSVIAETAHLLIRDLKLRDQIIFRQNRRLVEFEKRTVANSFKKHLEELLAA